MSAKPTAAPLGLTATGALFTARLNGGMTPLPKVFTSVNV